MLFADDMAIVVETEEDLFSGFLMCNFNSVLCSSKLVVVCYYELKILSKSHFLKIVIILFTTNYTPLV